MFKHKNDQKKLTKIALIAATVSLTTSIFLGVVVFTDKQIMTTVEKSNINNLLESRHLIHQITFCYDNKIHPCDLDQIMAWNKAHPDDTLNLVPPSL